MENRAHHHLQSSKPSSSSPASVRRFHEWIASYIERKHRRLPFRSSLFITTFLFAFPCSPPFPRGPQLLTHLLSAVSVYVCSSLALAKLILVVVVVVVLCELYSRSESFFEHSVTALQPTLFLSVLRLPPKSRRSKGTGTFHLLLLLLFLVMLLLLSLFYGASVYVGLWVCVCVCSDLVIFDFDNLLVMMMALLKVVKTQIGRMFTHDVVLP